MGIMNKCNLKANDCCEMTKRGFQRCGITDFDILLKTTETYFQRYHIIRNKLVEHENSLNGC